MPVKGKRLIQVLFFQAVLLCGMICVVPAGRAVTQEDQSAFQQANEAYRQNDFAEAARLYAPLHEKFPQNSVLAFNLGNSLFRAGRLGEAILAFERARLAAPRNRDIRHNLNYVSSLLEYRVEDKRNWYIRSGEEVLSYFREREVYLLLLGGYFLLMAAWIFSLYFRRGEPWGWFRKSLLAMTAVFMVLAIAKNVETRVMRDAIVVAREAEVHFGPSLDSQVAFRLGQGLKANVIDSRQDWSRILLVNMESGWVQNKDIAEV